jgi:mannosidase alpha-like ER degradation enhancer 1/mannosidase alpha-like ER degradation enhancer 2
MKAQIVMLSNSVKQEFVRSWDTYKRYAWGHDVLLPLTKDHADWYEQSLGIAPIGAYSTMKLMGLQKQAREVEKYVTDSFSFNADVYVKTFDANKRVLGGLLAVYSYTHHPKVLEKAKDAGDRLLRAFTTPTGIPYYWVNLKTGKARGERVSTAEAAAYTFEMGILSYYTKDPRYYQAAKKATLAIYGRRSSINLVGNMINSETGEWLETVSCIGAGGDAYYEYLLKTWLLFKDPEIKDMWEQTISAIHKYDAEETDTAIWYRRTDMYSGEMKNSTVTLYDAFFPALLCIDDDAERAAKVQCTWNKLWKRYGLEPMIYDYRKQAPGSAVYELNPEIIESAWYLYDYTKDTAYLQMGKQYYEDMLRYCRTSTAFSSIADVRTKKQQNQLPAFFFAETLKYLYLLFTPDAGLNTADYVFSTEGHPFRIADFREAEVRRRLGIQE